MSSKMYLLSFTLANCDEHDVEHIAVSSKRKNLIAEAKLHCQVLNEDSGTDTKKTVGKWEHRHATYWYAPVLSDGKDSQEIYYTIVEVLKI